MRRELAAQSLRLHAGGHHAAGAAVNLLAASFSAVTMACAIGFEMPARYVVATGLLGLLNVWIAWRQER